MTLRIRPAPTDSINSIALRFTATRAHTGPLYQCDVWEAGVGAELTVYLFFMC